MAKGVPTVQVLMSTYNGAQKIDKQVKSIVNQYGVRTKILIRDDGSNDDTKSILLSLIKTYPYEVSVIFGLNVGWRASFFELLKASSDFDYYAFSDQDDVWFPKKLLNSINAMSNTVKGPQLTHVQSLEVDEQFQLMANPQKKIVRPSGFKMALCTEVFQGCSMVWNAEAMEKIKANMPNSKTIPHDFWVGLIVYICGKISFVEEPQFYHIRYTDNSSTDGNIFRGRIKRLKDLLKGKNAYINPAADLLNSSLVLNEEQNTFLNHLLEYTNSLKVKSDLLFDLDFRRPTKLGTLLLKLSILFDQY